MSTLHDYRVRGAATAVRLHRFHECLAVHVRACDGGTGRPVANETVYLSPATVAALATVFAQFLADPEYRATFGTIVVDASGERVPE